MSINDRGRKKQARGGRESDGLALVKPSAIRHSPQWTRYSTT
jgi:hypothetical protein